MALALVLVGATVAATIDLGTRRIPNVLTGGIAGLGLLLAGLHVTGAGLAAAVGVSAVLSKRMSSGPSCIRLKPRSGV